MDAFTVISQPGPLPIQNVTFDAPVDGPVVFVVTGSAYSTETNVPIGYVVYLDDTVIGTATLFSNGNETHRALPTLFIDVDLSNGGSHTCSIMATGGQVTTDSNDPFTVQILY
jgi:hypothetical protein